MNCHTVCYRIDDLDTIVFTDDAWFEFARQNDFPNPQVVGTSLWRHITDPTTAHLYQSLVFHVRASHQAVQVSFRCDSPSERRLMRLEVVPEMSGRILFRCTAQEVNRRERLPMLELDVPRYAEVLTMCSWCKCVRLADQWVEIDKAAEMLGLFESQKQPQITHAICDRCERQFHYDSRIPSD